MFFSQEMEGGQVMFIREDGDGCERVCCKQQRHCALYVHEGHDQTGNVIMQVRKRSFLAIIHIKCSFYQGRLWTNIGKPLQKRVLPFCCRSTSHSA